MHGMPRWETSHLTLRALQERQALAALLRAFAAALGLLGSMITMVVGVGIASGLLRATDNEEVPKGESGNKRTLR